VVDIAHKDFPGQTKAQVGTPGLKREPIFSFDNTKSRTKLGLQYHTKEQTFHDAIVQLLEFEKRSK
jgi:hypothetical protein